MQNSSDPFSLEGKNIIVSGASSGIGRQCAWSCEAKGATVILLGRDRNRLDQTLKGMSNITKHLVYSLDLCDYSRVEDILRDAVAKVGKIDGVINSAGISTTLPFKLVKDGNLERFFQVNVYAAINLSRLVLKTCYMSETGGSIIFISSVMAEAGEVGKSVYCMTKGALLSGSRSLAMEYASRKIRFNCISPGVVATPMSQKSVYSRDDVSYKKIVELHPLGIGQTTDVAYACIYLLSDASKWVTGSNLVVDGGYLAH